MLAFSAQVIAQWVPYVLAATAVVRVPFVVAANAFTALTNPAATCAAHDAATKNGVACQQQAIEHRNAAVDDQHDVAVEMLINWEAVTPG